jgi:hypothetical protein
VVPRRIHNVIVTLFDTPLAARQPEALEEKASIHLILLKVAARSLKNAQLVNSAGSLC